eukprot:TRINITY_DN4353_c0_g2_i1.p1 TRINITY_DN4353_c0_g2~~TRINITY_DN4353_c0_g2_i1.p1  ORF type:complete len:200 (+),score=55.98 TRINITY_DN4353_c0_g2_i1:48-647(+)
MNRLSRKGILKRPITSSSGEKRKKSLVWDEVNLMENEVSKVPRTKITEPKTPYHHTSIPLEDDAVWSTLGETTWGDEFENACEDFASHQKTPPTSPSKALTDSQRHARAMTDFLETHTREQSWDSIGKDENKDQEQEQDYVFETVSFSDIRDSDEEDTEKKKAFQNRRKAHYNEYLMISRLRQDDDEDEEESAQTSSAN